MSKKTKTTQQSTTVQTPNVPQWIQGPYQQYTGEVSGLLGRDPSSYSVGANSNQQQAFARAGGLTNSPMLAQGQQALQGLLGYTPQTVSAGSVSATPVSMAGNSYNPAQVGLRGNYNAQQMGATGNYNANQMGDLSGNYDAAQLAGTDLSPYFNPYQSNVIDASMRDYDNLLGQTFNTLKAQTPTGAFGGSRQGVAMGQAGADAARQQAGLLANLRSQGFQNAQGAAFQDIGARNQFRAQQNQDLFGRDTFNTSALNQFLAQSNQDAFNREQYNTGARNQFQAQQNADLINVDQLNANARDRAMYAGNADNLSTQQYNSGQGLAAQQFNVGQNMDAQRFNSGQGLAGANFNAGIANNMFANGLNADQNERANIGLLGQMGDQERSIALANNPELQRATWLASLGGLLGQTNPQLFTGQTANTTGSGTQSGGMLGGLLGGAGSLFQGLGMLRGG
jgi:hypothetical protein